MTLITIKTRHTFTLGKKMEYYRDLNSDDFPTQAAYEAERIKRGLACGFTYRQIGLHRIIDLGLYLGMTQEEIVKQVGNDTGYIFSATSQ